MRVRIAVLGGVLLAGCHHAPAQSEPAPEVTSVAARDDSLARRQREDGGRYLFILRGNGPLCGGDGGKRRECGAGDGHREHGAARNGRQETRAHGRGR